MAILRRIRNKFITFCHLNGNQSQKKQNQPTNGQDNAQPPVIEKKMIQLQGNESVRVVMFVQYPAVWASWQSVYKTMSQNPDIDVKIILTPFLHHLSSVAVVYEQMKCLLINENIPFYTLDCFSFLAFHPHIVFLQNPYESTRPQKIHIDKILQAGSRIAYIPYGLEVGGGAWNLSAQFDSDVHKHAWRIFARSNQHRNMFARHCSVGNGHVVVTGHPKFDLVQKPINETENYIKLKNKIGSRKVILWTPHFSVGLPATWSTYRIYSQKIFEIFTNSSLFLLIRPHPLFFHTMRLNQVWDETGETCFRKMIATHDNFGLDESASYHEAFSFANALMTDVGSFLLEFLPTSKPILYLKHPEGLGLIDEKEQLHGYYVASKQEEIKEFVDMVQNGQDPLLKIREQSIQNLIFGLDGQIGKRICEHVVDSLQKADDAIPMLTKTKNDNDIRNILGKDMMRFILSDSEKKNNQGKEKTLTSILEKLSPIGKAIDLNCQDGCFSFLLSKFSDRVDAFSPSSVLINQASLRYKSKSICFMVSGIEQISVSEKYDLVFCLDKLSFILDDIEYLRTIEKFSALLKPNGYLIIVDRFSLEDEKKEVILDKFTVKYRQLTDFLQILSLKGFIPYMEKPFLEDRKKGHIGKVIVLKSITH